jgi:hypothetical protein
MSTQKALLTPEEEEGGCIQVVDDVLALKIKTD